MAITGRPFRPKTRRSMAGSRRMFPRYGVTRELVAAAALQLQRPRPIQHLHPLRHLLPSQRQHQPAAVGAEPAQLPGIPPRSFARGLWSASAAITTPHNFAAKAPTRPLLATAALRAREIPGSRRFHAAVEVVVERQLRHRRQLPRLRRITHPRRPQLPLPLAPCNSLYTRT